MSLVAIDSPVRLPVSPRRAGPRPVPFLLPGAWHAAVAPLAFRGRRDRGAPVAAGSQPGCPPGEPRTLWSSRKRTERAPGARSGTLQTAGWPPASGSSREASPTAPRGVSGLGRGHLGVADPAHVHGHVLHLRMALQLCPARDGTTLCPRSRSPRHATAQRAPRASRKREGGGGGRDSPPPGPTGVPPPGQPSLLLGAEVGRRGRTLSRPPFGQALASF